MNQALGVANKYARGRYAVCPACGCKPCAPDCNGDKAPAPAPLSALRPHASGNAIPFEAFDGYPGLGSSQRLMLLYLCRLTFGYGHHRGDLLSLGQLSERSGLSYAAVKRALNGLEARGLIARSRRFERASRERAATHIEVILPSEVGSERAEVGSERANLVGSERANGRLRKSQRSAQKEPYLRDVPKSLPKEGESSPELMRIIQLELV